MQVNEITISGEVAAAPIFTKTNGTANLFIDLSHQSGPSDFELVRCLAVGETAFNLIKLQRGDSILVRGKLSTGRNADSESKNVPQTDCTQVLKCEFVGSKTAGESK